MSEDEPKYPTWKWVVAIACTIIGFLILQGMNSINAQIDSKVDKAVYESEKARDRADIAEIKRMVTCVYEWHLPADLRKQRGDK